jgi:hypothetical protein
VLSPDTAICPDSPAPHDTALPVSSTDDSSLTDPVPTSAAPVLDSLEPLPAASLRPVTHGLRGIRQVKQRIDGTVAWLAACVAQAVSDPTAEPRHFRAALGIPHWRDAMEQEYDALIKK